MRPLLRSLRHRPSDSDVSGLWRPNVHAEGGVAGNDHFDKDSKNENNSQNAIEAPGSAISLEAMSIGGTRRGESWGNGWNPGAKEKARHGAG